MIDWGNLFANGLWILGCALTLAAFSYASWQASLADESLRARLGSIGIQRAFYLAGLSFCVGLSLLSDSIWEFVLWAILGAFFGAGLLLSARSREKAG